MAELEPTPSQTVGPFFSFGLTQEPANELVARGSTGAIELTGRVLDGAGDGLPDALVEIWQAGPDGVYRGDFGWGRSGTGPDGEFAFVTVKPGRVAGPQGTLQAPHLTLLVFARGMLKAAQTRVYFADEAEANAEDPVLTGIEEETARASLIASRAERGFRFDIHLQGDRQTAFFALK
jgi:protocatechuate 3,4-dioxygenase alpha subunit